MWILIIIVFVLVLLVITVLLSKINMDIRLSKYGKNDEVVFNITMLYGLIRYHYDLPMLKFENMKKGLTVKVNKRKNVGMGASTSKEDSETQVNRRKIDLWMREVHEILEATESFKIWMKRTLSRLSIVKLTWSTQFSIGDAASTAIATGVVWSVKTFIIGWLSYQVRMKNHPQLVVVPVFEDNPQFSTDISCTAHITLGYALYAGSVLIFRVLKIKGGVKRWKALLFKR
ncbi:DUF2953 domain-containing protein [Paenibacillus macquariensis]|uniref:DUF2953 domain-containing protein n=1 Tax=Paenibacillus macquariensis TaxID=948756 RepID=A0ABY1JJZ1_9BACL|nr:DUF2953 domain-containing protein [Paenibacillus macquariensis]MEC0089812.1 DUF2953 domain-containing protein [Paenibacillus macquariensis]OAB30719.1 hypothetical protein PMSM_21490 [Paenibacillus macquariensis subsp. macquariensis]SIQ31727.1 Protein of unknown function [Paenibacillus macquariensis]